MSLLRSIPRFVSSPFRPRRAHLKPLTLPLFSSARKYTVPASIPQANLKNEKLDIPIIGVAAALKAKEDPGFKAKAMIFDEFKIEGGVAVVTGANGGLGLEMALSLAEQGCSVHCLDLPPAPSANFLASASFASSLSNGSSLTYHSVNVTDQPAISALIEGITAEKGRLDVCVAAAGILGPPHVKGLDLSPKDWRKVYEVNATGVWFAAQAAAKGMRSAGSKGSIILIASMSGSLTNRSHDWIAYNSSKSAVLQMARSLACEVGLDGIRVNSISPGHIYTKMTAVLLDEFPEYRTSWSNANPLGRLGQVHELRGVTAWLASSASSFCTGSDILVSGGHHAW